MARDARAESPDSGRGRGSDDGDKKPKSRRPANTAFRQQRLKAWQPILTPKTVIPLFFVVGIIFAPLGGLMLYASSTVQELVIDYTNCVLPPDQGGAPITQNINDTNGIADIPGGYTQVFHSTDADASNPQWLQWTRDVPYYMGMPVLDNSTIQPGGKAFNVPTRVCSLFFSIQDDLAPPIFLYYRLTNFYQNHRRYVKSFASDQLAGTASSASEIAGSSCDPLTLDGKGRPYYPCGIVANSQFNDTFDSPIWLNPSDTQNHQPEVYQMTNQGIAWSTDAQLYGNNSYTDLSSIAVPPFWAGRWPNQSYTSTNPPPNLHTYEEFQVWMRTAGLPNFSKLALRNDADTMNTGRYRLDINYQFNVTEYAGTKSIVISTSSVIGGRNPFLGIAFVVVAGLCVLLGLAFTAAQLIKPRKLGDHTHLTWNNEQPSTATATGVSRPGASEAS